MERSRLSTNSNSHEPIVHHLVSSRETSPVRHQIQAREVFLDKQALAPKLVIFMCGLPARGKSYVSRKLKRYLNWIGFKTEVFNVGHRRRQSRPPSPISLQLQKLAMTSTEDADSNSHDKSSSKTSHPHDFFDPENLEARGRRDKWAIEVLDTALNWLRHGGHVAIHDATNSTVERRQLVSNYILENASDFNIQTIFIENICTDEKILETNIRMKTSSPDYINMSPEAAIRDFMERMKNYEKSYETIGDEDEARDASYIKLINVGKKVISYSIQGYVQSQLIMYLTNIHIYPREIWMTTHGLSRRGSECKKDDRELEDSGRLYSAALSQFLQSKYGPTGDHSLQIWTSMLKRSIQMAEYFPETYRYRHSATLDELYPGEFDDVRLDEKAASVFFERLRPLIIELERVPVSVLLVARDAFLCALCAYFFDVPPHIAFQLRVPLHSVVCLKPQPYGTDVVLYEFDEENESFLEVSGGWELLLCDNSESHQHTSSTE